MVELPVPPSHIARMLGEALTTPVRVASVMADTIPVVGEIAGDVTRDSASLALAATELTARTVASNLPGHPLAAVHTGEPTAGTVAVELPPLSDDPADSGNPVGTVHVHVREDDDITTYAAPGVVVHEHRRVHYDFFSGIAPEIRNPGGALPGANQWDRKPTTDHPNPVILVHGTAGGGQTNWGTYVPLLVDQGFSVFTLTYGAIPGAPWPLSAMGGMRLIEDSAAEFGEFVDKVLTATGADRVDVVGHSQGTIVPNYWAKFLGGADKIRRYVSLAPLWHGTRAFGVLHARGTFNSLGILHASAAGAAVTSLSVPQMFEGSKFIEQLNADGGPYVKGISYTNISTSHDEFVVPYTNGQVAGPEGSDVTNIIVQDGCPDDHSDHLGICGSPRAAAIVLNALDDVDEHPVPCTHIPPLFG